jgi:hypothetical protein
MQSFLTTVARLIDERNLPALMIGGHAVTALGHPRATFDLDLLIPRSSAEEWRKELILLRYRVFAESRGFLQFEPSPELLLPPVDLMLVDDDVFDELDRTRAELEPIATPGVTAMIALKLHASRQPGRTRVGQDWSDVMALIAAHQLSLDDPDFAAIVLRHGGEQAVRRIRSAIDRGS